MSDHAKIFQPSKGEVWVNCTGALALTKDLPEDGPTIHNTSGTLTHSIAECILTKGDLLKYAVGTAHNIEGFTHLVDGERLARAQLYADAIIARGGLQYYEVRLDLTPVVGIPGQFGTSDAVVIDMENGILEVHDLKDGSRKVDARDNWQMIIYALAAMAEYSYMCDFKTVSLHIHQPKVDHRSDVAYTIGEMHEFGVQVVKAAGRGYELMHPNANPKHVMAALNPGPWCEKGWCKARGTCPARKREMVAAVPDTTLVPTLLTVEEMGELLKREAGIVAWFKSLRAAAFATAQSGVTVPGWKLAEGRKGDRAWDKAELDAIGEEIYEVIQGDAYERKLISPAVAEKKLKKDHTEVWIGLQSKIRRADGQMSLVPEADERAAIQVGQVEFEVADGSDLL